MFCSKCGSRVWENVAFCPNCGAAINGNVQGEDNSAMQEYGNAAAAYMMDTHGIDGTMELTYHPYPSFLKGCVYVDNYYVTAGGNSIDRAHISGTKRCSQIHIRNYLMAIFMVALAFMFLLTVLATEKNGIQGAILIAIFIDLAVFNCMTAREDVLIIKGSGSADAITISTNARYRRELDPIENAVKALAASHDRDTNVRVQGAINRAHSEYQTDRIIDAINRE